MKAGEKNRWDWGKKRIWNVEAEQTPILFKFQSHVHLHMHTWKLKVQVYFYPFRCLFVQIHSGPTVWRDTTWSPCHLWSTSRTKLVQGYSSQDQYITAGQPLSLVLGACSSATVKIESGRLLRKHQHSVVLQVNDSLLKPYVMQTLRRKEKGTGWWRKLTQESGKAEEKKEGSCICTGLCGYCTDSGGHLENGNLIYSHPRPR